MGKSLPSWFRDTAADPSAACRCHNEMSFMQCKEYISIDFDSLGLPVMNSDALNMSLWIWFYKVAERAVWNGRTRNK